MIATLGRPEVVAQTLRRILDRQTYKPASVIISCIKPEDAGEAATWGDVTVVTGRPGLATQRNAALVEEASAAAQASTASSRLPGGSTAGCSSYWWC